MKRPHRKLAVYISGFLIGGVVAAIGRRWKEAPRFSRFAFVLSIAALVAVVAWLIWRAF